MSNLRCVSTPHLCRKGLPANTVATATVNGGWRLASRAGPFAGEPAPTRRAVSNLRCVSTNDLCVGAGLPANTVATAKVNGGWRLASRAGPFAGEPAPTRRAVSNHRCVSTNDLCVGAGLPANTVATATVNGGWRLASRPGPFAGKPDPTAACVQPPMCVHPHLCRSGFTREYGGDGKGERRVKIGQQARPFRG